MQARELWSSDEKKHLRPGHFWACELGDANGKGSPILHTFTQKSEYFTLRVQSSEFILVKNDKLTRKALTEPLPANDGTQPRAGF